MLFFSPAKINIGLQIVKRRADGFHQICTAMVPLGLCDILEILIVPGSQEKIRWSNSGISAGVPLEENLCIRAHELFTRHSNLLPVEMHLHKQIPVGAGLGGGSSNAASVLNGLNMMSGLPLSREALAEMASQLGSDCAFFLHQSPMLAEGRGEILFPVTLPLEGITLVLFDGGFHISTTEAYRNVEPRIPEVSLAEWLRKPVEQWKEIVVNDFEASIFRLFPPLSELKQEIYRSGALYASLTGSGSALYGIYKGTPELSPDLVEKRIWSGPLPI